MLSSVYILTCSEVFRLIYLKINDPSVHDVVCGNFCMGLTLYQFIG